VSQPYPQPPASGSPYPTQQHGQYAAPPQGYAQQAYAAPPQAYAAPQQGYAQQGHAAVGQTVACRFCGCVPAVETTFREHQGMLILMRFVHLEGPFCRDCGLATFRQMTSRTMAMGWWSYGSLIVAPVTLLINLFRYGKVANLAAPQPNPYGPSRRPMEQGKPVMARPISYVAVLLPLLVFVIILANLAGSS
jgi:hypothetical protein